jgi:hypothetical protein
MRGFGDLEGTIMERVWSAGRPLPAGPAHLGGPLPAVAGGVLADPACCVFGVGYL